MKKVKTQSTEALPRFIAFKASDEMAKGLAKVSAETGMSVSHVIRLIVMDALNRGVSGPTIAGK